MLENICLFVCLFVCAGPGPCQKVWFSPVEGHPIYRDLALSPRQFDCLLHPDWVVRGEGSIFVTLQSWDFTEVNIYFFRGSISSGLDCDQAYDPPWNP